MTRGEEHAAKVNRVRAWLRSRGHDGALLRTLGGFAWVTAGGEGHVTLGDAVAVGAVLVTADRVVLLTNAIEAPRLRDEEVAELGLEIRQWPWQDPGGLESAVAGVAAVSRVAVDTPTPSFVHDASLAALRYTLLPPEIARYRALGRDAAGVIEAVGRAVAPGQTERDVAGLIAQRCYALGIAPVTNLVAADERLRRYRHPVPTGTPVRELVMLVLTGRRGGLHVSLTRLVAWTPPSDDLRRRHRAVARVDTALIAASRPGQRLDEALAAGLRQYAAEGFAEEWQRHHQGGLTGYAGREIFATPGAAHRLEAGQGVAWNPSIEGTKSEDTILVTDAGPECLTRTERWPSLQPGDRGALPRPDILVR